MEYGLVITELTWVKELRKKNKFSSVDSLRNKEVSVLKRKIPFYVPLLDEKEQSSVLGVLQSGWLTTGPLTRKFEQNFCEYIGCKNAIAVNSCTAALHLALDAISLEEGDEVLVPTMTFASTGEIVNYFRAKPVLVDCEKSSLLIDVKKIEEKISDKTRAIIPVHFAGQPCDLDEINQIAQMHKLKVIEDAAHSLPAMFDGKMIGTLGDISCFSFYATKPITTGEGGMITTENAEYAERMRIMSLHGISRDAWKRYSDGGSWNYEIVANGYKYNMTDITAALGVVQLKKSDKFLCRRKKIAEMYTNSFKEVPEIVSPRVKANRTHSWHLYVIQLELECLKISRAQFIELMKEKGIGCSVHFIPLHRHSFYRESFGYSALDFPNANFVYERIVSLPIFPKMTDEDIFYVVDGVRDIINKHRK